jgi:WD40 repeat protein
MARRLRRGGHRDLWNVGSGVPRFLSEEIPYRVSDLLFSGDGKQLVAGYTDGSIRFWDLATQEARHTFRHGESPADSAITNLRWSGSRGGETSEFLLFRTHMKPFGEFRLLNWKKGVDQALSVGKSVEVLAVAPGGRTLIVGPPAELRGMPRRPLSSKQLEAVRAEAKSRPALKHFRIVAPLAGKEEGMEMDARRGGEPVPPVAVSPDGKYVVESISGQRLVEADSGRILCKLDDFELVPVFVADGRALLVWNNYAHHALRLVESSSGKERWRVMFDKPIGTVTASPCGHWLAVTERDADVLRLLNAATGTEVVEHKPGRLYHGVGPLSFSPDGKLLARSAADGTVLLWRVPERPPSKGDALSAEELASAWRDLASDKAAVAFSALQRLADAPKSSVPLLRKELLLEEDKARIDALVSALGSTVFVDRERAYRTLEALGEKARPHLTKALRAGPSLEAQRRLERLVAGLATPFATATGLRQLRAIETLERIGSEEAGRALEELAEGAEEDPVCREARITIERMRERLATAP